MKNAGKILLGLAGLFAAGVAVGVLYAPDKGERTRRRIARNSRRFFHSANDVIEEGKDTLHEIRDRMKDELDRLSHCRTTG